MAASVLANELGRELYRVDLAQITSKYIGETQKNIGKIFDEAQQTDCILFFDEADALFSKHSEARRARTICQRARLPIATAKPSNMKELQFSTFCFRFVTKPFAGASPLCSASPCDAGCAGIVAQDLPESASEGR
jgi:hypothetical protein